MNELENADTAKLFVMKMNVGMMCLSVTILRKCMSLKMFIPYRFLG